MPTDLDATGLINEQLLMLSMSEGYCDLTFRNRKPILNARLSPALGAAMVSGAGPEKLGRMLMSMETRDGEKFSAFDVWVIVPFGRRAPSEEQLLSADISNADDDIGTGATLRQIARDAYHCSNEEEVEAMLRRMAVS